MDEAIWELYSDDSADSEPIFIEGRQDQIIKKNNTKLDKKYNNIFYLFFKKIYDYLNTFNLWKPKFLLRQ